MQEQADIGCFGPLGDTPEDLGDEQQVIIVYPDQIACAINLGKLLGKGFIRLEVSVPVLGFRWLFGGDILPEEVVEEGPES